MGAQAPFECAALPLLFLSLPVLFVGSGAQQGKNSLQFFKRLRFSLKPLSFNNRSSCPDELVTIKVIGVSAWDGRIKPGRPRTSGPAGVACPRVNLFIY